MRVLNLYAGIGGNRKFWGDCDVTAVEIDEDIAEVYQRLNPDDAVVVSDAHEYLLENFDEYDFIWSSPPCQSHSRMIRSGRNRTPRYPDLKLYEEIIFLKHNFKKGCWVVENVEPYYQRLIDYQRVGRHAFWCDFYIPSFKEPNMKNFINECTVESKKKLMDWLGIHFDENIYYGDNHDPCQILRNCVHPELGKHVFGVYLDNTKWLF